jgi:hypothetical protein
MIREQRLRAAIESSVEKLVSPSGDRDEQVMFQALGECLTWICAFEELLWPRSNYANRRDNDAQGKLLPGLRYARNSLVHGDNVVHVADPTEVPMARVTMRAGGRSQIFMPPTHVAWTFKPNLPPPPPRWQTKRYWTEKQAYEDIARLNPEAIAVIRGAVEWFDRELAPA